MCPRNCSVGFSSRRARWVIEDCVSNAPRSASRRACRGGCTRRGPALRALIALVAPRGDICTAPRFPGLPGAPRVTTFAGTANSIAFEFFFVDAAAAVGTTNKVHRPSRSKVAGAIVCNMLLVLPSRAVPNLRQAEAGTRPAGRLRSEQRGKRLHARDRRVVNGRMLTRLIDQSWPAIGS